MTHVENFDVAVRNILDRLKQWLKADSDSSLAQMLGVQRSTIATWVRRNSLDWALLFAKCNGVDLNWLVYGTSIATVNSSKTDSELLTQLETRIKDLENELSFARGQAQAFKAMAEQAMSLSKTGGTVVKGMAKGFR